MLTAAFFFVSMNALIARMSQELHPFEVTFFRVLFGFLVLVPAILHAGPAALRTRKLHLHAFRGVLNSASMLMFFYGLTLTPLAGAAALGYATPLFVTLGAALVLGEKIRARRIAALVIGMAGTLVVLRPGGGEIGLGPLLILGSTVFNAIVTLDIKIMARTESNLNMAVYQLLFIMPIAGFAAYFVWQWPSWSQLAWLLLLGGCGSAGQLLMTQAFKQAEAALLMPLDFSKLIISAAMGFLFFGQVPDLWTWIGGTIVFSSTAYIAYREHQLARNRPLPPAN